MLSYFAASLETAEPPGATEQVQHAKADAQQSSSFAGSLEGGTTKVVQDNGKPVPDVGDIMDKVIAKVRAEIELLLERRDEQLRNKIMGEVSYLVSATQKQSPEVAAMKLQQQDSSVQFREMVKKLDALEANNAALEANNAALAGEIFKSELRFSEFEGVLNEMHGGRDLFVAPAMKRKQYEDNAADTAQLQSKLDAICDSMAGLDSQDVLKRLDVLEQGVMALRAVETKQASAVQGLQEESAQKLEREVTGSLGRFSKFSALYSYQPQQAMDYPMSYEFEDSTWDMMVFLGLGVMNFADSVLGALASMLTVFVQLIFVFIVARSMTDDPLLDKDVEQLKKWRMMTGHQVEYWDQFSDTSLVERVCAGSLTLLRAGTQTGVYGDLDNYLAQTATANDWNAWILDIGFMNAFDGSVLCILCFFLWTLGCTKECFLISSLFQALYAKLEKPVLCQVGHGTYLRREGNTFELAVLGKRRFIALLFFNFGPRIFILGLLYFYGSLFLLHTTSLGDLILNALALTFILEIDDEVFEVLAPFSARAILDNCEPVFIKRVTRRSPMYMIVDCRSLCGFIFLIALVLIMYFWILKTFVDHMHEAHNVLCGGNTQFVTAVNLADGLMYYHETGGNPSAWDTTKNDYIQAAVSRLANIEGTYTKADQLQYNVRSESKLYLQEIKLLSKQASANMYTCSDHIESFDVAKMSAVVTFFKRVLTNYADDAESQTSQNPFATGVKKTIQCSELQPYCITPREPSLGFTVRVLCPVTCSCDDPFAGIYDLSGCSSVCQAQRSGELSQLIAGNCEDYNLTSGNDTQDLMTFTSFIGEFEQALTSDGLKKSVFNSLGITNESYSLAEAARYHGCELAEMFSDYGVTPSPCDDNYPTLGNIRAYCPTSCDVLCPPEPPTNGGLGGPPGGGPGGPPAGGMGGPPADPGGMGGIGGGGVGEEQGGGVGGGPGGQPSMNGNQTQNGQNGGNQTQNGQNGGNQTQTAGHQSGQTGNQSGQQSGQSGQSGQQSGQTGGQSGQQSGQSGQSGQTGNQSGQQSGQSGQSGQQSGQTGGQNGQQSGQQSGQTGGQSGQSGQQGGQTGGR